MKVLFAVSNEEISESIVKKYQKEYKQIISYKNVYYFNAILKEIQKDKSYDRIVISEDLEAFTSTQYEQIDKFIFDKLDSISDEASNSMGSDIPIILICSDRRNKSEQLLVKLFGIGVYNAIIGNDRSIDEVCKLINRPRAKKEAKVYYKIEAEDVNYQAESENDVSEMEIQNIVAHYKRLGKDESRYIDSFNNIAAQYNDTQLRIISKFLPLNVRAVLEEKSTKYQQIMSFNNTVSDTLRKQKETDDGPSVKFIGSQKNKNIMSRPVVIPSAVNMNASRKLSRVKKEPIIEDLKDDEIKENKAEGFETINPQLEEIDNELGFTPIDATELEMEKESIVDANPEPTPVKRKRGRPPKQKVATEENSVPPVKRKRGRPPKKKVEDEFSMLPGLEEKEVEETTILPGIEDIDEKEQEVPNILPGLGNDIDDDVDQEPVILPGFDDVDIDEYEEDEQNKQNETTVLPGLEDIADDDYSQNQASYDNNNYNYNNNDNNYNDNNSNDNYYKPNNDYSTNQYNAKRNSTYESTIDLSPLLTSDKKIVTFVGTSKNGTSFIVNNIAQLMSSMGVNTAILDTTKNKNSYYIYTNNEEELRQIAMSSVENLVQGNAQGIKVNNNLTVYTSLPGDDEQLDNVDEILQTLLQNHSLILIDTDFDTSVGYFKQSQETYLVQSLDILTIQPLTAFLNELRFKNILDQDKLRIILNKVVKIRGINEKTIIGGMANYNDPTMSNMTELFNRNNIRYVSIPFEEDIYTLYLKGIIECDISLKGYSKMFMQTLKELGNMIYPMGSSRNNSYAPPSVGYGRSNFSANMNNTLDQMKRNY